MCRRLRKAYSPESIAMVIVMIWRPRGLMSSREPSIVLHDEGKAISGAHVKEGHG